MKLAEALAARKDIVSRISESTEDSATDILVRDEDDPRASDVDPYEFLESLQAKYDEAARLSIAINETNNVTHIEYLSGTYSLMEAIAMRECLRLKARAIGNIINHVSRLVKTDYYSRRQKDTVRSVSLVPLSDLRNLKNSLEADLRRLDSAIQTANWTVDLLE
jgi:hypothetical protein